MTNKTQTKADAIAKGMVLGAAVIFAAVFVFLLRRRGLHGGGSFTAYLAVTAALALLHASAIFWRSSARQKLLLVTFSVVFSVYLTELALTVIGKPAPTPVAGTPGTIATADPRTKLEVVRDLRAAGTNAWPTVHPQMFLASGGLPVSGGATLLPLGGISRVRTVYCLESDAYALFDSDEHGFNNPLGLHRKGEVDVALIGDSFVHGACVQQGEDVTSLLRKASLRALSLGNGGDGPLAELATLIEYAAPLRPRVVLWLYYEGNDLLDLENERRTPALMRYVDGDFSAHLLDHQDALDEAMKSFVESKRDVIKKEEEPQAGSSVMRALKLSALRDRFKVNTFPEPSPLFTRTLQRSKETVAGWGGKLYFVYLPEWSRYPGQPPKTNWKFRSYGLVLAAVKRLDVPVIDFQESVAALEDPLSQFPQRQPGHYSPAGYARLAEVIRARLAADKALP
ncbi:MAG: hypothetical protein ACMG6S_29485 [Byssovorax sp.]